MQHIGPKLVKLIDKDVQTDEARKKGRTHLGASVLGRKCLRQIWYGWRWMHITQHQGRLLRLFNRGHREEPAFVALLRRRGFVVRTHAERLMYHDGSDSYISMPWGAAPSDSGDKAEDQIWRECDDVSEDPVHLARAEARGQGVKQITFSDHNGHFGGSGDAILHGAAADLGVAVPDGLGLGEFKTAGEKAFIELAGKLEDWRKHVTDPAKNPFTGKGVLSAKIEHYVQMQIYMRYFGLSWALYVVVCKNTDDLYMEVVHYKPEMAEAYADRAGHLIAAQYPPAKITQDPSWWECKFCDYREICHRGATPSKNCRSCVYARPVEGGVWTCDKYHQAIPKDFMPQGCAAWEAITP